MKTYTPEEIDSAFNALPPEVTTAMLELDIDDREHFLIEKYKLHTDKAGIFINSVTMFIVGLISADAFSTMVIDELGLEREDSQKFIDNVNELIFGALRQKMIEGQTLSSEDTPVIPKDEIISVDLDSPTQEKNTTNILKDAKIELIKPRETAISDALDTTDAQALTRDALIKSLENPTRNDTSMPHPQIQKPANVGIASAIQTAKIIPPVVKLQDMPVPQQFVGMPKNQPESTAPSTPTPTQAPVPQGNVVAQKLQTTFKIPKQESNYTLPQVTGSADKQKDLYREAI